MAKNSSKITSDISVKIQQNTLEMKIQLDSTGTMFANFGIIARWITADQ